MSNGPNPGETSLVALTRRGQAVPLPAGRARRRVALRDLGLDQQREQHQ